MNAYTWFRPPAQAGSDRILSDDCLVSVPAASPECEKFRAAGYPEYPSQAEAQAAEHLALGDADSPAQAAAQVAESAVLDAADRVIEQWLQGT